MIKHDVIRQFATQKISQALGKMGQSFSQEDIYKLLVEPPNPELGDLSYGCFLLAKTLKKGPPQVAQELASHIELTEGLIQAQAAGPYLNLTISTDLFGEKVLTEIFSGEFFKKQLVEKAPKTMIEYSQPNTHKELHVGHMRNLCLGDAIIRMLRYSGRDILSATFPGDMGTHVAKCLWYMQKHNQEPAPATGKGEWLGSMYSKAHLLLEDQKGTPQEDINRQELTTILQQLESKSGPYFDLWIETRQWSIDLMKKTYKWADVEFDHWFFESEMDSPSVQWVKELYAEGKLEKSEGAIGKNLEEEKLGFCLLLKSDGTGLYATKDLLLAKHKFENYHIEKSVYIVDMRQALHFKQVFRVLEILGFKQAKDCFHLQYNYVELPDGAMSSRKGNIVPLQSLVNNMQNHVKTQYLARYEGEWSQDDVERISAIIAKGAIFYGMLKMDTNKKVIFDMNEWLKLDGESGPFIQYSYARIASLGRKFPRNEGVLDWSKLTHFSERRLLQMISGFNTLVATAAENYKPASVCSYLYDLAKAFNVFYHECPIGTEADESIRNARLALAEAVGLVLKNGLGVIGISAPEKM